MAEPIIGILGGMGPLAGADFLARLTLATEAARDQDHLRAVLWSDPTVPDRTAAALAGGPSPLPAMLAGVRVLEQAGAGCLAIPCNTAHLWADGITAATRLPLIHIVDAAAAALAARGIGGGTIGLMGTAATLRLGLYQDRLAAHGYACLVPTEAEMAEAVSPAIARVKANDLAGAAAPLLGVATALAGRGAAAVVLGCTEIPLALRGPDAEASGLMLVDTIDALARAVLAWARPG
ncbi:aspartate/glutamate racemase family protein [Elioraea sp.]|uniref:aspartate/glutamate racemase family protein n=1 Tax=Elioraea sp. TaxID=2185103 RepID=UPI0025BFF6F0|nr:amino acid racemase [Elioraea sp.]